MPEGPIGEWQSRPVFWSTLGYLRWWMATDGVYLELARAGMTPALLRRISDNYGVVRGIKKKEPPTKADARQFPGLQNDRSAEILCKLLEPVSQPEWPSDLAGKAEACRKIMDNALKARIAVGISRGKRKGEPRDLVSAITKLVWFIHPEGWTVFDDYAATGLGLPKGNARNRMRAFYDELYRANAQVLADRLQPIINASIVPDLKPMRIIDTLLMARAEPTRMAAAVSDQMAFLTVLPEAFATDVTKLALSLQAEMDRDPHILTSPEKPRMPRKKKARA